MAIPQHGPRHIARGGRRHEPAALTLLQTARGHLGLPWQVAEAARCRHTEEHLRVLAGRIVEGARVLAHDQALGVLDRVSLG